MYVIAGLGNPGSQYEMTRHNIGFEALDYIADKYSIKVKKIKHKAVIGEGTICGEKVLLVKPQTFMNNSGESIGEIASFYKVPPENIIIIYDDVALEVAKIRIRKGGSAGGHNGMKSIIYHLNSDQFPRIRIGVGSPTHADYDLADYVLGRFDKSEIKPLEEAIIKTADALELIIKDNIDKAMNKYN